MGGEWGEFSSPVFLMTGLLAGEERQEAAILDPLTAPEDDCTVPNNSAGTLCGVAVGYRRCCQ